jgi:ATP-dependent helicase/nuclease subunit B
MSDPQATLPGNVFTIPTGVPFADALAAGLMARAGSDPLALSRMIVLLPNRRACRALADAFLRQAGAGARGLAEQPGRGMLLPRLQPIGEPDEESQAIADVGSAGDGADIPPAIGELRRRMLLARLVHLSPQARLGAITGSGDAGPIPFDQAVRLAAELGALIDQVATERLDFSKVKDLAPADSEYWQLTVRFLDLVQAHWPEILAAEGAMDQPARRNLLLERQCALWKARPPQGPVIAAGSTGSIPASADLIAVVAGLPQGMVVLPGLDRGADAESWAAIAEDQSHPQFGMHHLLGRLGVPLEAVRLWPSEGFAGASPLRARIVADALLPAAVTERWELRAEALIGGGQSLDAVRQAWSGVTRIDCATEQEEAGVIALLLRRAVDQAAPRRAALVTPDRSLARRVTAELGRWGIAIDDSAGEALRMTPPAAFFLLIAEAAAADWAPVPLLALMKHPLAAGGRAPVAFRAEVRALERAILRGPRPAPGLAGLRHTIESALHTEGIREGEQAALRRAARFADHLLALAGGFDRLDGKHPLADRLTAHVELAEALAATDAEDGAKRLWREEAGEALADFVQELVEAGRGMPPLDAMDYAALLPELMSGIAVRPRYGRHPRLFIWGPLEARLQQADYVVLGGLNEGIWPPEPPIDPWLSRPMRRDFGLPAPERRIGLSAHDFQQSLGATQVVLTRALRAGGQPTIPSRWLLRLDAYLQRLGIDYQQSAPLWRGWQRRFDRAERPQAVARPVPRPGARYRPSNLSVTRVETWMRDPYAIYARHILALRPLDELDQEPDVAELGNLIHEALDAFVRAFPKELPPDALERLRAIGETAFHPYQDRAAVMAFWWPRFERVARWFVALEQERRPLLAMSESERQGKLVIDAVTPPFTLTARADRIDRKRAGGLVLIDYKTGAVPHMSDVVLGLSPQLSLEAAIAHAGGFEGIGASAIDSLEYWRLTGGVVPGAVEAVRNPGRSTTPIDPNLLAADALAGLQRLLAAFSREDAAYPAVPRADAAPRFNDYEHLARIAEWSVGEGDSDG